MRSLTFFLKLAVLATISCVSFSNSLSKEPASQQTIPLTSAEADYLKAKGRILMCIDPKWMPYEGINKQGQHEGISADYIALVSERIGIPIILHPTESWKETLASAKNRSCDIISMARETEERKAFLNFTSSYVSFPYVIGSLFQQNYISSLEDNLDKTYSVVEGYAINDYLKNRYPDIKILPVKNIDEGIEKLRSGETYGHLNSLLTLGYYISKKGALDIKVTGQTDFNSEASIASRNDEPLLNTTLQKALNTLTEQDKQKILDRWINIDVPAKKTPEDELAQLTFSESEKEFILTNPDVSMCVDPNWMPYEAIQNNTHTGIAGDVMRLVSKRSGLNISLKETANRNDTLAAFKSGQCDVLSMVNKTPERDQYLSYTRPYFNGHVVFVARNEQSYIADPSKISGKTVAVVKGYSISEFLKRDFPQLELIEVKDYDSAFELVAKGEVDLTADYLISSGERIQRLGLYGLKIAGNTPYKNFLRIGVQKDQRQLREILDKTVASIESHEIKAIVDQWRTVRYDQQIDKTLLWQIVLGASLIVVFSFFWNRRLRHAKAKTQQALDKLAHAQEKLEKMAITDKLTGIYNRAKLDETLEHELRRAERFTNTFGILLIDLDRFKKVNDTYGHQVGDDVLVEVAKILSKETRHIDTVGRWGGEEFMVICPEANLEETKQIGEKLRVRIESYDFPVAGHQTASFGATTFQKADGRENLIARVDANLYQAKENGRNCLVAS